MAPATWTVRRGRTLALEAGEGGEPVDAVLLPGLVNAHAHLDLSTSAALPAGPDFPSWLLAVGAARDGGGDVASGAREAAEGLARRGVVAVGDIDANRGLATRARRTVLPQGPAYLEIVGVTRDAARSRLLGALDALDALGGTSVAGLSPHAPYSLHHEVVPEIVRAARHRGARLAMHLAESEEETRYLLRGDGPFTGFLDTLGHGRPFERAPGLRPVAWAERVGLLAAGATVIHGNDLDDDDIGLLLRHDTPVVYCHGTHRHFDRPAHRLGELAAAGLPVALGTDSAASNRAVDLLDEVRRLAGDRPDLTPGMLLRAASEGGRRALGLAEGPARFAPGSAADGLLLSGISDDVLTAGADAVAGWALSEAARVHTTVAAGRRLPAIGSA